LQTDAGVAVPKAAANETGSVEGRVGPDERQEKIWKLQHLIQQSLIKNEELSQRAICMFSVKCRQRSWSYAVDGDATPKESSDQKDQEVPVNLIGRQTWR
jgi:hypothetical protein